MTVDYHNNIAFTKNPFMVQFSATENELSEEAGLMKKSFDIRANGALVDTIDLYFLKQEDDTYFASLDLAQFARNYVSREVAWESLPSNISTDDADYWRTASLTRISLLEANATTALLTVKFVNGGMSRHSLRIAQTLGYYAINERLLDNTQTNCIASTRTSGKHFYIYPSELSYLPFFTGDTPQQIGLMLKTTDKQYIHHITPVVNSVVGFDLSTFYETEGLTEFYVYRANTLSAHVHILAEPTCEEKHLFRFLNGYGMTELALLTGRGTKTYTQNENAEYMQYDEVIGDYTTHNQSSLQGVSMTVNTGHLNDWRASLIRDMLMSEKVEIWSNDGAFVPCAVAASDIEMANIRTIPESFNVTVTFDSEINPDKG